MAELVAASTPRRVRKHCSSSGCSKVDAGGGFCVGHGGGKKCSFPGCTKGYQTGGFCRKHGGGARCQVPGCTKVDAGKGMCRAHGGGRRCQAPECPKADVGGGFCTMHGGGRRCSEPGCTKIDQGGGRCRAHGGAKRCKKPDCTQPARGAAGLCSAHGGSRVCAAPNCRRLARGDRDGKLCASCARRHRQLDETLVVTDAETKPTDWRPQLTIDVSDKSIARMSDDAMMVPTKLEKQTSSNDKCDGSQVANCLDNGCARSYGSRCNCTENCTCNHSSPTSSTSLMLGQRSMAPVSTPLEDDELFQPRSQTVSMKRFLVRVQLHQEQADSIFNIDSVVALIATLPGVRSAHTYSRDEHLSPPHCEENGASTCSGLTQMVVVRGSLSLDLRSNLASLSSVTLCQVEIVEETELAWMRNEVVLLVDGMMCAGNCGSTVLRAVRSVDHVESAHLIFDERRVVVRGEMGADKLCETISSIGFDARVEETTPLPRQFRFRVNQLVSASRERTLKQSLSRVEGVEEVVVLAEPSEVFVVAMLQDASKLIEGGSSAGFALVPLLAPDAPQEESFGDGTALSSPRLSLSCEIAMSSFADLPESDRPDVADVDPSHTCDTSVCPQNSCPRYMMTVAHAAALAVGWSVPGCGMANGRECTCGDACKCKGCPQHNPGS